MTYLDEVEERMRLAKKYDLAYLYLWKSINDIPELLRRLRIADEALKSIAKQKYLTMNISSKSQENPYVEVIWDKTASKALAEIREDAP